MMTLDEFRAWARPRCRVIEGEAMPCLEWQGATINKGRHPRASIGGKLVQVRRLAYSLLHTSKEAQLGKAAARPSCGCDLCVEPTHLARVTASEFRSVPKSMAARMRMQKAARAARSHVKDPETIVPLVIADPRPAWQVAQELGLGPDVIRDMRRGKWSTGGMFGQLIAANDARRRA